uniref:28S ribosomal protein S18a, mitochondrial n=1 Tax=Amphimedon queenslandica TaxID=400682 RepID=A0A1X7U9B2_AMPQE
MWKFSVYLPQASCTTRAFSSSLLRLKRNKFGHKDVLVLRQFMTPEGYLINKRVSGVCKKMQRKLAKSIKIARNLGYLPRKPQALINQST